MIDPQYTPAGESLTELVLEIFRLNGRLLAAGDALVEALGMTSARWQVLGAVALSPAPEPVARLARSMGLNRQGVQRIVNEMVADGFLSFADNPHHRRARLVLMTERGREAYEAAAAVQVPWANALAAGLDPAELGMARSLLSTLRRRLDQA